MPQYVDATTGRQVSASIAAFPNGRAKPGFREMMSPGEHVGFDVAFTDGATPHSVFLTDGGADPFAQVRAVRDAARGNASFFSTPAAPAANLRQAAPAIDASQLAIVRDAAREIAKHH